MKILIIDDEPYVEALIKGWFRSSDHELNFLQSGAALMREGATFVKKYDVVIIDKQLPEVDGLQIGKHLKENYPELVTIWPQQQGSQYEKHPNSWTKQPGQCF